MDERENQAPNVPTLNCYKLTFGVNKKLEITEKIKVVEAYAHNSGNRVTLIYKGLGSYTFNLKKAKSLIVPSPWFCKFNGREFTVDLKFRPKKSLAIGECKDENDKDVKVKLNLRKDNTMSWDGNYETEDDMINILIEDLRFDGDSFQCEWSDEDGRIFNIDGEVGQIIPNTLKRRQVDFTLIEKANYETNSKKTYKYFSGTIDPLQTKMKGKWGEKKGKEEHYFEF